MDELIFVIADINNSEKDVKILMKDQNPANIFRYFLTCRKTICIPPYLLLMRLKKISDFNPSDSWIANLPCIEETKLFVESYKSKKTADMPKWIVKDDIKVEENPKMIVTQESILEMCLKMTDTKDEVLQDICRIALNSLSPAELNIKHGPLNSIPSVGCVSGDGCRMLLCMCREEDHDWFKGECDICDIVILKKERALRYPSQGGGWVGCYCSWECLTESSSPLSDAMEEFRMEQLKNSIEVLGIKE